MKVIKIEGLTEQLKDYDSTVFIIFRNGKIHCENVSLGYFPRPDLTPETLQKHIDTMKAEGFSITEVEF